MHQVLQPNLNIVLGGKKSKLQHVDFVYTWMAVPFFWVLFLVCVVKIEPRNHWICCASFDLNQSRLFLGLFCLDFLLPTKLLNCFESCSNIPGMLIFYTPCPLIFLLLFLVSWGDFEIANPAFAPPPSDATAPGGTPPRVTMAGGCVVCRQKTRGPPVPK
jgi:hypothetical protein